MPPFLGLAFRPTFLSEVLQFLNVPVSFGGPNRQASHPRKRGGMTHNESLWGIAGPPEVVHTVHGAQEWQRLSTGAGSKGERWSDWQCRVQAEPEHTDWGRYLSFRRSPADPDNRRCGLRAAGLRTWRR